MQETQQTRRNFLTKTAAAGLMMATPKVFGGLVKKEGLEDWVRDAVSDNTEIAFAVQSKIGMYYRRRICEAIKQYGFKEALEFPRYVNTCPMKMIWNSEKNYWQYVSPQILEKDNKKLKIYALGSAIDYDKNCKNLLSHIDRTIVDVILHSFIEKFKAENINEFYGMTVTINEELYTQSNRIGFSFKCYGLIHL